MTLRAIAEADLGRILEGEIGFRWPITVTDPTGTTAELFGFSNDIGQMIDPDTGTAISGRSASVALRIAHLAAGGLGLPVAIAESTKKPWIVQFDDIGGTSWTFKVSSSMPDRALGIVTCTLEAYKVAP